VCVTDILLESVRLGEKEIVVKARKQRRSAAMVKISPEAVGLLLTGFFCTGISSNRLWRLAASKARIPESDRYTGLENTRKHRSVWA